MVFFKYITQTTPVNTGYLQIFLPGKAAGNNFEYVQIKTSISVTLQIGYLLLIKDSSQAFYYTYQSYSFTGYVQLTASQQFAPNGSYKCFLGLKLFNELPGSTVPYFMKSLASTSNSTNEVIYGYTKSSFNEGMYFLFCLAACSDGLQLIEICPYPYSCSYICQACSDGFYLIKFCPYPNNCSNICQACKEECLTCINPNQCVKCKFGTFTDGGCTDISACAKVNSTQSYKISRCIECIFPNLLDSKGGCSKCPLDYLYAQPYCIKTTGCIAAAKQNQTVRCITCDISQNFEIKPVNSVCQCKHGFSIVDNVCKDICGDGQKYRLQCDDGNLVSGDGCSEKCVTEKGFLCVTNKNQRSQCIYNRQDIKLSLQKIEKVRFQNKAIMTFLFKPVLLMGDLANISEGITLLTNRSTTIEDKELIGNELTLWVDFSEDLEDYDASLIVLFQNSALRQSKAEVQFKMQSNGLLIAAKYNYLLKQEIKIIRYFSIVVMVIYGLSLFFHRTMALQFLFPFQIIYLSYISNSHPTAFTTVLNSLGLSCFNFMLSNDYSNVLTNGTTEDFGEGNMETTVWVMLTLFAALTAIRIIKLAVRNKDKKTQRQKGLKLKYLFFVVDNFLFSLSISFLVVSFLLLTGESMRYKSTSLKIMMLPIQFIISIEYFQSWRKTDTGETSQNLQWHIHSPKANYIPILLGFYLSAALTLAMANQSYFSEVQITLSAYLFVFLVTVIFYPPYSAFLNNLGVIFSILFTIFFLTWFKVRNQIPEYRHKENELLILSVLIALMLISTLITIVRVMKLIYKLYLIKQRIDQLTLKMKQQISESEIRSQIAGLQNFRAQTLISNKIKKEGNIFNISEEISFSKFDVHPHQNNDLKNYLLKLSKDHQGRIGSNIINQ